MERGLLCSLSNPTKDMEGRSTLMPCDPSPWTVPTSPRMHQRTDNAPFHRGCSNNGPAESVFISWRGQSKRGVKIGGGVVSQRRKRKTMEGVCEWKREGVRRNLKKQRLNARENGEKSQHNLQQTLTAPHWPSCKR